ncbi:MAG TPA: hypothetical protein VF600_13650 [Abditibacteriaceae bacterium]|jgi:hypothetical protein
MSITHLSTECAIAEILESSTTGWTAQCRELHCAPAFGSFVRAPEDERRAVVYGVVSHIETVPFDASRRPSALWTSEDEMDARHPQIGKLLRTTFAARSIGWSEGGTIIYSLPQQPPRLHSFTNVCSFEDVRRFTERFEWVRLLMDSSATPGAGADELLVAVCREAVRAHENDSKYKIKLGQTLAVPLRADYHRLRAILSRLEV